MINILHSVKYLQFTYCFVWTFLQSTLPGPTRPTRCFLKLPDPDPTCYFSTLHNTSCRNVLFISSSLLFIWMLSQNAANCCLLNFALGKIGQSFFTVLSAHHLLFFSCGDGKKKYIQKKREKEIQDMMQWYCEDLKVVKDASDLNSRCFLKYVN